MEAELKQLKEKLASASTAEAVALLWQKYLGKQGSIKLLVKALADLPEAEKKIRGPLLQSWYQEAQALFVAKQSALSQASLEDILQAQAETLDLSRPKIGHLHPLTQTIRLMNKIFIDLGYSIMEEREIETDEFCFQRLNVPADHPARDMQDTIYIQEPNVLLRTQTSSIEARVLANYKPPFKVVAPGRVYRNEKVNKSNHFIFHHYQGFVVLPTASLQDLFGTFNHLFKKMYGPDVVIRFRNKYYPEVEPGVGPDMQCFSCQGHGCPLCKGVGWIEMGGAGMIHPKVLSLAGIDSTKWRGYAFGLGLDRWVMAKYNITDIRTLLGGNLGYKYHQNENTL
ncbi:MAG: Phenylalanine-tRNA ligase alpha subunit [Candidatus Falkowbacteria bacterium GW2011_GWA2_39_24]|uniref:Phenylalanine-tRNA ligase alpha subunit n=1 Tax=Candidatus Falkowbacteria bacterium GW2011_GWA2_39_24 TaxID=1618634 RepID=A0A0G0RNG0_9BACT|nr:MAG: Phenylalanine-tRNA ligase alpha subunit [Candidatus Falkowbacteria bacterium GW2011_GWA2_39_24]